MIKWHLPLKQIKEINDMQLKFLARSSCLKLWLHQQQSRFNVSKVQTSKFNRKFGNIPYGNPINSSLKKLLEPDRDTFYIEHLR